ncbi:MAG: NACHT domain-containing protein [Bariatricus sp.]
MDSSSMILALSGVIVKAIANIVLGTHAPIDGTDIATVCTAFFKSDGALAPLQANMKFSSMQESLYNGFDEILSRSRLSEDQKNFVLESVKKSIQQSDLSSAHLAQLHNAPRALYNELIAHIENPNHVSEQELDYIKRCLYYASSQLITIVSQVLPDFSAMNFKEILDVLAGIEKLIAKNQGELLRSVQVQKDSTKEFYEDYMYRLKTHYSSVELFSSKVSEGFTKNYSLDAAYIDLFFNIQKVAQDENLSVPELLAQGNRWLFIGEAGCGKTTLLKWLASSIASGSLKNKKIEKLEGYFPVIVTLRENTEWNDIGLGQFIKQELHETGYRLPKNLVKEFSTTGKKLLLLIDGLDEIDEIKRDALYSWLFTLNKDRNDGVESYNKQLEKEHGKNISDKQRAKNELIIIVTSRPIIESPAVNNLKDDLGLSMAYFQPMSPMDVQRFVDYWHKAISEGRHIDVSFLAEKAAALKANLASQESLSRLAQNPLLCAMICALNYRSSGAMPTNKIELYDACAQMLLEDREKMRKISLGQFEDLAEFQYEDKKRVLSRLALWMFENNGDLLVERARAERFLMESIFSFQWVPNYATQDKHRLVSTIIDYFVERGSILRLIGNGKIGFIHKTFQEYFAACQINLYESWGSITLPDRALSTLWREVLLLAVSMSSIKNAEYVINTFLCRSGQRDDPNIPSDNDPRRSITYKLLAISCTAAAREVLPNTKSDIAVCTKSLIPPQSRDIEKALATCGNLVVPLLAYTDNMNEGFKAACERVLLDIRTKQALAMLVPYIESNSKKLYSIFANRLNQIPDETLLVSGIIPSFVKLTLYHMVNRKDGSITVSLDVLKRLSLISRFCSFEFAPIPDTYILSRDLAIQSRRRLSAQNLIIENYRLKKPLPYDTVLKVLDLFSIFPSYSSLSLSYEGGPQKLNYFVSVLSQFPQLRRLTLYDVSEAVKIELENKVSDLKTRRGLFKELNLNLIVNPRLNIN